MHNSMHFFVSCLIRHVLIDFIKKCPGFSEFIKLSKKKVPINNLTNVLNLVNVFLSDFDYTNSHNTENNVAVLKTLLTNTPMAKESIIPITLSQITKS